MPVSNVIQKFLSAQRGYYRNDFLRVRTGRFKMISLNTRKPSRSHPVTRFRLFCGYGLLETNGSRTVSDPRMNYEFARAAINDEETCRAGELWGESRYRRDDAAI